MLTLYISAEHIKYKNQNFTNKNMKKIGKWLNWLMIGRDWWLNVASDVNSCGLDFSFVVVVVLFSFYWISTHVLVAGTALCDMLLPIKTKWANCSSSATLDSKGLIGP